MNILPIPQKMTVGEDKVRLGEFALICDDPKIKGFAAEFDCGGDYAVAFAHDGALGAQAYTLKLGADGAKIAYGDIAGAFYAVQTMRQIAAQVENGCVEAVEIEDAPSIANRGYMLDISRGKIPKIEYLLRLVDLMAALKYNELQLYLDSFAIAYKNYPEYVKDTQPLTLDELHRLDDYCKARFIRFVPNQNTFGHMHAWTAKPEIAPLAITGKDGRPSGTLDPLKPESVEFIDSILDGWFNEFDSDRANVGMDETVELGMNETKAACDERGVGAVYTEYLGKICSLVTEKYGKTPMFWDDIIFKHPEQLENVPANAIVMQWGYETEHHYDRNSRRISESGRRFYVCPGTSMWGSITGRSNNALLNITTAAECGAYYGAEGFLLTEWGDDGHPQFPETSLFPLTVGAAASWNCMSHDHEIAYDQRRGMVRACKWYLDRFCYKSSGGFADIVFRMGNFYLLERDLTFNGTQLWDFTHHPEKMSDDCRVYFDHIVRYMEGLLNEFMDCDGDEEAKSAILCNSEIVITLASILADGKSRATSQQLDTLIKQYRRLWLRDNHERGVEIFIKFLESQK